MSSRGVIVASDLTQEWLLPWWWSHYQKHTPYPVAFIDLGMSFPMKDWCKEHGQHIPLRVVDFALEKENLDPKSAKEWEENWGTFFWESRNAWFKKPFACLSSPFEKSLWIDLDCEVRGSLEPLFGYANGIAMAKEQSISNSPYLLYNSGVIAFDKGTSLLMEWAERCVKENDRFCGDQDIFSSLVSEKKVEISELPPVYNWSRSCPERADVVIQHWHGPPGKIAIRHQIQQELLP